MVLNYSAKGAGWESWPFCLYSFSYLPLVLACVCVCARMCVHTWGTEPRALLMLETHFTTLLHPSPQPSSFHSPPRVLTHCSAGPAELLPGAPWMVSEQVCDFLGCSFRSILDCGSLCFIRHFPHFLPQIYWNRSSFIDSSHWVIVIGYIYSFTIIFIAFWER